MLDAGQTMLVGIGTLIISILFIHKFRNRIGEKYSRKLIHISNGLVSAGATFLTEPSFYWGVSLTAVITLCMLIGFRLLAKKNAVYGEAMYTTSKFESYGEVLFPVMFIILPPVTKLDYLTYFLPVMIITLSDSAAALLGRNIKSRKLNDDKEGTKTVAGFLGFFFTTIVILGVGLPFGGIKPDLHFVSFMVVVSLSLAVVEVSSTNGEDNLLLPLCAYIYLKTYHSLEFHLSWLLLVIITGIIIWKVSVHCTVLVKMQAINHVLIASLCFGFRTGLLVLCLLTIHGLIKDKNKITVYQTKWLQGALSLAGFILIARMGR